MSACICRLQADECTGSSGIYYPLQDGGQCAIQDCEKQVTTDNSAALVNALAEIDSLQTLVASHRMVQAKLLVEKYELGQVIKRKDAAMRVALDRLKAIAWPSAETMKVITTIKEALA